MCIRDRSDTERVPFSREQRALIYQRAKHANDVRPFGTLQDVYDVDYEWTVSYTHLDVYKRKIRTGL